jgi:hypothetical protein
LSIFEVFLKNIQRICPIRLVCAQHNGQACPPAYPLRLPVSLRTPSMTTLVAANVDMVSQNYHGHSVNGHGWQEDVQTTLVKIELLPIAMCFEVGWMEFMKK